jgi:DNA repair exonuclease SbcCD nuclease subunit
MKFLHTADWQIGMRATMLGDKGVRVRAARLESARHVIALARRERAEFVVLAGDTFEDNGVERLKVREVAKILGGADCPVFIIPGNHDPLTPGSVWEDTVWNEWTNLHVLTQPRPVETAAATLYPCPVIAGDSRDDPSGWIQTQGNTIAIGIAHGSVESAAYQATLPIRRDAARVHGLDYLALGHFHSTTLHADDAGAVHMAYSGTHESTGFTESDSGNVLIVDIPYRGAGPQIQTLRTASLEWMSLFSKIEKPGQVRALAARLDALPTPERTLIDLTLTGVLFGADYDALTRLVEIVEGRFLFGRHDLTHLVSDETGPEWIERLPEGYLRDAAHQLLGMAADNPPDPVAADALREYSRLWREVCK